jgi:hypothetical protein
LAQRFEDIEALVICDEIPGSFLLQRLFPFLKKLLWQKKFQFLTLPQDLPQSLSANALVLHLKEEAPQSGMGQARLSWKGQANNLNFTPLTNHRF